MANKSETLRYERAVLLSLPIRSSMVILLIPFQENPVEEKRKNVFCQSLKSMKQRCQSLKQAGSEVQHEQTKHIH